jgi:hypothetical protein
MGAPTGSDGSRTARSGRQIEPEFRSGKSLFFVIGSPANSPSEVLNQVAEKADSLARGGSIFVPQRHETGLSAASSDGRLFVPLSQRQQ